MQSYNDILNCANFFVNFFSDYLLLILQLFDSHIDVAYIFFEEQQPVLDVSEVNFENQPLIEHEIVFCKVKI